MQRHGQHIPFSTSGSYPARVGNAVHPMVDGEPAFRRICEAAEAARHSVWVTVSFIKRNMQMPDGRGTFFDVLDAAVDRGLDVRAIFWRSDPDTTHPESHFPGTSEQRAWLAERGSRFQAVWDRAQKRYCQHQKSWMIDAGKEHEVAFVGGINLHPNSVVSPGHSPREVVGSTHDVYVEIVGPSATDVHHNFVQRWNEASERTLDDGVWPSAVGHAKLAHPQALSSEVGEATVQIQRTVRAGHYSDSTATPGGECFAIGAGEYSTLEQYLSAIDAARSTIYIEDQAIGAPQVIERLQVACDRGIDVVCLVPVKMADMSRTRQDPKSRPFFEALATLGSSPRFTLAGIASNRPDRGYQDIHVHAKIALIDDVWATIGSTNIANRSFYGDVELNASFWHGPTVKALRCELLSEHLDRDTSALDDRASLRLFRQVAAENAKRRACIESLRGLAFELDAATYGS